MCVAGLPEQYYSLTWFLSPILGLIFTPLIGSASDRCTLSWGRRRPFILALCVGVLFGVALFLNGSAIGECPAPGSGGHGAGLHWACRYEEPRPPILAGAAGGRPWPPGGGQAAGPTWECRGNLFSGSASCCDPFVFNAYLTPRPVSSIISEIIFSFFFFLLFSDLVLKMSRPSLLLVFLVHIFGVCFASFCCFVFS